MHRFGWTYLPVPNTIIHRLKQLVSCNQQPEALEFKFDLGVWVVDLPPNPDNEVKDETRSLTVKVVSAKDTEQHMEDTANGNEPCKKEESDYIDEYDNKLTVQMEKLRIHNQWEECCKRNPQYMDECCWRNYR